MASIFLRSSRSWLEESSSLSEKSRWCPVMHRVPRTGGRSGCRSSTSSTLAFLMCSENSISFLSQSKRQSTPLVKAPHSNHFLASLEKTKASFLLWAPQSCWVSFWFFIISLFILVSVCFDKAPINRGTFMIAWTYPDPFQRDSACWTQGSCGNGRTSWLTEVTKDGSARFLMKMCHIFTAKNFLRFWGWGDARAIH